MKEAEWLTCKDPELMLEFLQEKVSDRKLRLFGCACCHRIWQWIVDEQCRKAVLVAEHFAEGLVTTEECISAGEAANHVADTVKEGVDDYVASLGLSHHIVVKTSPTPFREPT